MHARVVLSAEPEEHASGRNPSRGHLGAVGRLEPEYRVYMYPV